MGERRDRRVWNRTRGQWLRSILITFGITVVASGALFGVVTTLVRVAGTYIGPYVGPGFPHPEYDGAGIGALALGLAVAGAWGWIGRPRLLAADTGRVGGDTSGARLWDGSDLDAPDSAADSEEVTG